MKISRTSFVAFLITAAWTPLVLANGILTDGNFDNLEIGSAPDNNEPAGAWEIRRRVVPGHSADTEDDPSQMSIVSTSSFDGGANGNSLRVDFPRSYTGTFLHNVFDESIEEAEGEIVRASFDFYVPDNGTSTQGGFSVYVGGDHGGGGSGEPTDRGPQISIDSRGRLLATECSSNVGPGAHCPGWRNNVLLRETALDTWQHVQLDIDLVDDSFDVFFSVDNEPLGLIAANERFRSGPIEFLDRFAVAVLTGFPSAPVGEAFLDNFSLEVLTKTPGDANLDGVVNFPDFLALSEHFGEGSRRDPRGWSQGDFDGDGEVTFPDFLILSENFGTVAAAASAASVPEPTAGSIALFGLLGLMGFRKRR